MCTTRFYSIQLKRFTETKSGRKVSRAFTIIVWDDLLPRRGIHIKCAEGRDSDATLTDVGGKGWPVCKKRVAIDVNARGYVERGARRSYDKRSQVYSPSQVD